MGPGMKTEGSYVGPGLKTGGSCFLRTRQTEAHSTGLFKGFNYLNFYPVGGFAREVKGILQISRGLSL